MALPLSLILNAEDVSPRKAQNVDHPLRGFSTTEDDAVNCRATAAGASKSATYGDLPVITLSPVRGKLYHRRVSRSPQHLQNLDQHQHKRQKTSEAPDSDLESEEDPDEPPEHEFDFNKFNIFKAFFDHPEILHVFTTNLEVDDLLSLYAISRDFHEFCNRRFTAMILGQSVSKAKESTEIFKWKVFKNMCQDDPAERLNEEASPRELKNGEIGIPIRDVPTFRWLKMVLHRESVVDEILEVLNGEGHRLPGHCSIVLKKIWFTMGIPDNGRRIGLMHNKKFWTNKDLVYGTLFLIKLDMLLTDPLSGKGERSMRKMLMAQPTLTTLWQVLKREELCNQYDMMRMYVHWKWRPRPEHRGMSICGIPPEYIGSLQYEGYGKGTRKLIPPDALILRESIKRDLHMHDRLVDMLLFGNINSKTFVDIWPTEPVGQEEEEAWSDTDDSSDEDETEDEDLVEPDDLELRG
ncbi:hypothetical protein MMC18_007466 [Xylographa bjoerkii]|nr:hypothetical protein [Xylographa bjoerkii]MCJ1394504.1 hypothetical protein [Xylographa bjoerkii]MCJ1394586.1 hypothetical protein [Xylographa bjoerkii]